LRTISVSVRVRDPSAASDAKVRYRASRVIPVYGDIIHDFLKNERMLSD
jgi:hypothetical protein